MVFYDFKLRGGDLQGLTPRFSFLCDGFILFY